MCTVFKFLRAPSAVRRAQLQPRRENKIDRLQHAVLLEYTMANASCPAA